MTPRPQDRDTAATPSPADDIRRALRALGDTRIATLIDQETAEKGYALLAEIERLEALLPDDDSGELEPA